MPSVAELEPQSLLCPLNHKAQQSLAQLVHNQAQRKRLQDRQQKAIAALTGSAAQLNDRGTEADRRLAKRRTRRQAAGEEEDADLLDDNTAFQEKIRELTKTMDYRVRNIIDDQNWVQAVPDMIRAVAARTGAIGEATQRQTQGSIPFSTQRSQWTGRESGEGVDDGDSDCEMTLDEDQRTTSDEPNPSETPAALLRAALETDDALWTGKSLTEKYSTNNDYIGFYSAVHDAKYPGEDAPSVPHASTWFAAEEGRQTEVSVRPGETSNISDDEIEIQGEKIRIKCPYTQQTFQNPWSSKKCPHSFEKEAFFHALKTTDKHLPWTDEQELELRHLRGPARARREKEIRTPIVTCPECGKALEETDVHANPVLLRKVQRIVAREQKERDALSDDDDEDNEPSGTQRNILGLESSPVRTPIRKSNAVKMRNG